MVRSAGSPGCQAGKLFSSACLFEQPSGVLCTLHVGLLLQAGHDFVVGGQLRTDKQRVGAGYNTNDITCGGPGRQRLLRGGGNVWQHLRSFRKSLFDAVPDAQLRFASTTAASNIPTASSSTSTSTVGTAAAAQQPVLQQPQQGPGSPGYYELANDWAFSVPMAELARKPGVLALPLYLYEPFWQRQDFAAREVVIGEPCQPAGLAWWSRGLQVFVTCAAQPWSSLLDSFSTGC